MFECDEITKKDIKSMKETHNTKLEAKQDHTARALAIIRQKTPVANDKKC